MSRAAASSPVRGDQASQPEAPKQQEQPEGQAPRAAQAETGKEHPMRQVRRLRLVGVSGAVPRARDFVRQALQDWGWLPAATGDQRAAAEDVLLVVSELVTNACLHAEGPRSCASAAAPRCCVWRSSTRAAARPPPATRTVPDGRAATACSSFSGSVWTGASCATPRASGKTVWAELAAPGA